MPVRFPATPLPQNPGAPVLRSPVPHRLIPLSLRRECMSLANPRLFPMFGEHAGDLGCFDYRLFFLLLCHPLRCCQMLGSNVKIQSIDDASQRGNTHITNSGKHGECQTCKGRVQVLPCEAREMRRSYDAAMLALPAAGHHLRTHRIQTRKVGLTLLNCSSVMVSLKSSWVLI
jgi:hypothetical protein